MGDCLGHFALSQYLADELSSEEQQRVSAHLSDCARCSSLLHQIEQDQVAYAELGQEHYNVAWRHAVAQSSGPGQTRRRVLFPLAWKIALPVAAVAAAAVVALLLPRLAPGPPTQEKGYKGYKGSLSLQIIAKRGKRQFVVSDNELLCPGDALRFSITAGSRKNHLVIFSLDRTGTLSPFYPNVTTPSRFLARSGKTIELTGQGRHVLPRSIILDQSQGREVIFMLAAPKPFDPRPLEARIRTIFKENRRDLIGDKIKFSGTIHTVVIIKGPCS